MEYFKSLTTTGLTELIKSTRKSLYLCLPSLHPEISDAIAELNFMENLGNGDVKINILIDFDAQTFRQGYGDFDSIEGLFMEGDDIKCLKDNRISFIISDDIGYYLFIESRSLIPADKETINAVRIDPVSKVRLKKFFFPEAEKTDFKNELANAIIEESKTLSEPEKLMSEKQAPVTEISENEIKELKTDLEQNPPLNPDFKRTVEFYSNKFQYVKLEFKGSNLMHRKLDLPSKALPVMDAVLKEKLETKLNLFDKDDEDKSFNPLNYYKTKIAELRESFLTKIKSREESLLNKTRKSDFEKQFKELEKGLENVKSETINNLAGQINTTKKRLLKDLTDFFIANPKALFPDHSNLWQNNDDYVKEEAPALAEEIVYKIKWPKAHLLVEEFKLIIQYSDITIEDLKNKDFISEIKEVGLINQKDINHLAEFGIGIKIKDK
jgi:hypothetical protein